MACASAAAQRPVLLLVDGHTTHIKLESSKLCSQENIILYCLLEHSSHIMQPLDLRLFSALKESLKFSVRAFQMEHPGELVTKQIFSRVLKKAWDKATTVDIGVKGFKEAGLFPLCPDVVINNPKLLPSRLFKAPATLSVSSGSSPIADTPGASPSKPELPESVKSTVTTASASSTASVCNLEPAPSCTSLPANQNLPSQGSLGDVTFSQAFPIVPAISTPDPKTSHSENEQDWGSFVLARPTLTNTITIDNLLSIPSVPKKLAKPKTQKTLPKAISGEEMQQYLEEKERDKQEAIKQKELRKKEREAKKIEKEKIKAEKAKERAQKKLERDQRKMSKRFISRKRKRQETDESEASSGSDTEKVQFAESDDDELAFSSSKCFRFVTT